VLRAGVFPAAARRVTGGLRDRGIRSVLLDIEGTTTPIAFVYEVLFPYARTNLEPFLRDHLDEAPVRATIQRLRIEWESDEAAGRHPPEWRDAAAGPDPASISAYVRWLMDRDRKSPGLKELQGRIWEAGYRSGALHGDVFDDVPAAFAAWRAAGIDIAIYSSGSVLAQRLLFETTRFGDLTKSIAAFFDTAVGPKASAESYKRIVDALGRRPPEVLFISDIGAELAASREVGCQTALSIRPGNSAQQVDSGTAMIRTFDEIFT
jgi:enolase-phosphatase E1